MHADDPQVTSDLAAFWAQGYAAVREGLLKRFPGAAWPEDPTQAGSGTEGAAPHTAAGRCCRALAGR